MSLLDTTRRISRDTTFLLFSFFFFLGIMLWSLPHYGSSVSSHFATLFPRTLDWFCFTPSSVRVCSLSCSSCWHGVGSIPLSSVFLVPLVAEIVGYDRAALLVLGGKKRSEKICHSQ